ncbi:diacylglycerol kinase [Tepidibacillus fermentans]|uniref:Diacylglycerol kinase (ATP) n=1 Tax=Tepidibacillus fermentans TaxID=1281767 RepID=A0A4R3KBL9_9BACI|nr:diacylglycerol kinase [Tepidibacillus fermentans]TCS80584.1 diacylglycerol kinase (ATP) [Tepidibacillus fermentans]
MKRARFIYNPSAGREDLKKQLADILDILDSYELETSCYATKGEFDATKAARDAVERNFDIVIAAGGDGTLYEVINGLSTYEKRPKLGIIPAGTTNDFARALGIPKDYKKAATIIGEQFSIPIDIGKYNDKYFINIAGGGTLTELTYEVPSKLKTILGQLAYYVRGIEKLPFLKPIPITIETEDMVYREEVMLFLIANSNSVGGFEKLAPYADLRDGLFDVIVIKKTNLPDFVRLASLALKGEHLNDPKVLHFKTRSLQVYSYGPDPVLVNLDGELGGQLPGKYEILPKHLEVFADEKLL